MVSLGVSLGAAFTRQHELFLKNSQPATKSPSNSPAWTGCCLFGSQCLPEVLSMIFTSFGTKGMTLIQYKIIASVCRHWRAVLLDTPVFIILQSVQRFPAFALVNPVVCPTEIRERYAHTSTITHCQPYSRSFFGTCADVFFKQHPKVRVRVPEQDMWILDAEKIKKWNRKSTRIVLPDKISVSMWESVLNFYPTYIEKLSRVYRALCDEGTIATGSAIPIIRSDTDLLDDPDNLVDFMDMFKTKFEPHPKEWHVVMSSLEPYLPHRSHTRERDLFFPPPQPTLPHHQMLQREIELIRLVTIRDAPKVVLYVYTTGFPAFDVPPFSHKRYDGFFPNLALRGLMPTFSGVTELEYHIIVCGNLKNDDLSVARSLEKEFADRGPAWKNSEELRKLHPALCTVRYFLSFEIYNSWSHSTSRKENILVGTQTWDPATRTFISVGSI